MKRAQATAALDDAFADSVKTLFNGLVTNLIDGTEDAAGKFHAGIARRDEAYAIASRELDAIFPE